MASQIWAGQEIGNGGGFALCSDNKYYSYDYLITLKNSFGPLRSSMTSHQHIKYIQAQLKRLDDRLLGSFNLFMSNLFTQGPGMRFQWFPQKNLPLKSEPVLASLLPLQCKTRKQAAYYIQEPTSIAKYLYDLDFIRQVENQPEGGLHVSFLLIHEWLWNYFHSDDFLSMALFNRLLHSEKLNQISWQEFNQIYTRLRFSKKWTPPNQSPQKIR